MGIGGMSTFGHVTPRVGEDYATGGVTYPYARTLLLEDQEIDSTPAAGVQGWTGIPGPTSVFRSSHFDRGVNTGGNALHGDGSVEWVPWNLTVNWMNLGATTDSFINRIPWQQ